MGVYEEFSQFSKAFSTSGSNLSAVAQDAVVGTDPSQPLESETTRAAQWPLLLIGVGLVLTLVWAGALLWMALQALAGVVAWLLG